MKAFSISRSLYYTFMVLFYTFCIIYFVTLFLCPFVLALFPIEMALSMHDSTILISLLATLPIGFLIANVLWIPDIILKPFEIFDKLYLKSKTWEL